MANVKKWEMIYRSYTINKGVLTPFFYKSFLQIVSKLVYNTYMLNNKYGG